jgi:hypothetical protein
MERTVDDPLAAALAEAWELGTGTALIEAVFGAGGLVASAWKPNEAEIRTLLDELQ